MQGNPAGEQGVRQRTEGHEPENTALEGKTPLQAKQGAHEEPIQGEGNQGAGRHAGTHLRVGAEAAQRPDPQHENQNRNRTTRVRRTQRLPHQQRRKHSPGKRKVGQTSQHQQAAARRRNRKTQNTKRKGPRRTRKAKEKRLARKRRKGRKGQERNTRSPAKATGRTKPNKTRQRHKTSSNRVLGVERCWRRKEKKKRRKKKEKMNAFLFSRFMSIYICFF